MKKVIETYDEILKELTNKIAEEVGLRKENIEVKHRNTKGDEKYRAHIKITPSIDSDEDETMSFEIWSSETGLLCFESDKELVEYEMPIDKEDFFEDIMFYYNYERDRILNKTYR